MNPIQFIVKEGSIQKTGGISNPDEGVAIGFFLRGDFDGDREITDKDGAIVSANYGGSNKSYAQGDSDYDGDVDFTDLLYVSQRSGVVLAEPPTAPGQLVAYTATLNDPSHEMKLDWLAPEAEFDGFKITRSTDSVNFDEIADVDAETFTFTDTGLTDGMKYWYRVRGYVDTGNGLEFSSTSNKAYGITILSSVSDLRAIRVDDETGYLSWDNESATATTLTIQRQVVPPPGSTGPWDEIGTVSASESEFFDNTLEAGISYQYRIQATGSFATTIASVITTLVVIV